MKGIVVVVGHGLLLRVQYFNHAVGYRTCDESGEYRLRGGWS
jgi:hypothetical protein